MEGTSSHTTTANPLLVKRSSVSCTFTKGHPARGTPVVPMGFKPACITRSTASNPSAS